MMLPFALTIEAFYPVTAPYTSGSLDRNRSAYEKVIAQFEVERNPRYRPANGKTWCKTFVWDVTRAMSAEIPHWWMGKELTANEAIQWLAGANGAAHGWKQELNSDAARVSALAGRPTVVVWRNPAPPPAHGHMAMVLPDSMELVIAQAGTANFSRCRINVGFGDKPVTFWSHP